jgi:hypothetical protein
VVIDRDGQVHSLARLIHGASTRDVRARDVDLQALPSVAEVRVEIERLKPLRGVVETFARASREVVRQPMQEPVQQPRRAVVARTRAVLAEMVEPYAGSKRSTPLRIPLRLPGKSQRQTYRGLRAILIAKFASKIANARRNVADHELAAAIEALSRAGGVGAKGTRGGERAAKGRGQGKKASAAAHPSAPHCSTLFSQTDRPILAPFDDQGYLSL